MEEMNLEVLSGKRILFVDDDPYTRKALERMLPSRCGEVLLAEDGSAGWELIQSDKPDLVITAIEMPNMNGLELLEKVKELNPAEPVVVITAFEDEAHEAKQADAILIKPVHRESLLRTLVSVLASRV